MICSTDILNLKSNIFDKIGQKIIVKGSLGRNKCFERKATIDKVYSNIFTIKYDEGARNATYSYTDILTRTVEVQVLNSDNTYCPLIPPPEPIVKRKYRIQNT